MFADFPYASETGSLLRMDHSAYFRLYEELNDYLPQDRRKRTFGLFLKHHMSVREAICSLGVPPNEVDLVLVNGESVPFSHIIRNGDRVSVYPIFETLDVRQVTKLRDTSLLALRSGKGSKKHQKR
jgi:sulfur carrier protein ThiS